MQVFKVQERGGHEATDSSPLDGKTPGRKAVALGHRAFISRVSAATEGPGRIGVGGRGRALLPVFDPAVKRGPRVAAFTISD